MEDEAEEMNADALTLLLAIDATRAHEQSGDRSAGGCTFCLFTQRARHLLRGGHWGWPSVWSRML